MTTVQEKLLNQAKDQYSKIFPCGERNSFSDCFTSYKGKIMFWFDTEDHSTHIVVSE